MKAILAALLIALVSTVLLQNHRLTVLKSAGATEASSVEMARTALQKQLHQLLLERKTIFESFVATERLAMESRRV